MAAINCTPNLPPSGYSVLGWRPGPPAVRTCPRTQYPSVPCYGPQPPLLLACQRPCEARNLKSPARPRIIRYIPDKQWPIRQPPCNPPPPVPPFTCGAIGSRKLTEHIQFKYSYPGQFRFLSVQFFCFDYLFGVSNLCSEYIYGCCKSVRLKVHYFMTTLVPQ